MGGLGHAVTTALRGTGNPLKNIKPSEHLKNIKADKAAIFNGTPAPAAPTPPPVVVMPDVNDTAISDAKRRRVAKIQQRGGRQSTILTDTTDRLGG